MKYPFAFYLDSVHEKNLLTDEPTTLTSCWKEKWEVPLDDSPLAFEAYYVFGPLGSYMYYHIRRLGISKYDKTLHELLRTIINFYMTICSKSSVISDIK